MPRTQASITSFNTGEATPLLEGHVDFPKYANSAALVKNLLPLKHGPVTRRQGTRFVNTTQTVSEDSILIEFEFSTTQTYVIEFGNLYVRFFANQGFIETTPGSGTPYELVSQYAEADLSQLRFTQSADVLYLVHPDHPPRKLVRAADNSWSFSDVEFIDGPYLSQNTDTSRTLTNSGTTGSITLTAIGFAPFVADDVGRLVRIEVNGGGDWGYVEITGFTSTTVVDADVKQDLNGTGATKNWRFGAWGETPGYPSVVTFHQQRLAFGGGANRDPGTDLVLNSAGPQAIWLSKSSDFENMAPTELDGTVSDDNAVTRVLDTAQVNDIRWLHSGRVLMVGTQGGEFKGAADNSGVITPSNFSFTSESNHGSYALQPAIVSSGVIFLQKAGRKLRELAFDFAEDSLRAPDVSVFGEHLTEGGIADMAYQQEPNGVIWLVKNDGSLLSFTYEKDQNVLAFAQQPLGGTDVKVKSVTSISSPLTNRDEVWFIVERTIDGATTKHVEFLEAEFEHSTDLEDAFFVDSGLTYSGAPATVISGLDHLEGETVQILADGAVVPPQAVVSGAVTLISTASKVQVGLGSQALLKTLPPNVLAETGGSQGLKQRAYQMTVLLYRSLGLKYGAEEDELDTLSFRKTSDPMDTALDLFTGPKNVVFPASWENEQSRTIVVQDQPLPMTVTALITRINVNDA